ncbi:MAG: hypothetical protein DBY27_05495 [Clostridiaceae bacterium]|nr:MAG: hypothetical protein DBY27_05495 [Clostridiaceae bacterium]
MYCKALYDLYSGINRACGVNPKIYKGYPSKQIGTIPMQYNVKNVLENVHTDSERLFVLI